MSAQELSTQLEKLRTEVADCVLISQLATDPARRELFRQIAEHLKGLAAEVERAIGNHPA